MASYSSVSPPCGTCTRASENKHWGCPPRMSDGRLFTDYRPRCDVNLQPMWESAPLSGSYDYRQMMIQNGEKLLGGWREEARKVAACGTCKSPFDIGTMLPEQDVFKCDKVQCVRIKKDPMGLGTGRSYGADASSQEWQSKLLAQRQKASEGAGKAPNCCDCPTYDNNSTAYLMATANINRSATTPSGDPRWAVPGGGRPLPSGGAGCPVSSS